MPAYAIAHLHHVDMGPEIIEYLNRIDASMAPFEGRFLVHGGKVQPLEGGWEGDLIIIEFPDWEHAADWYASPAYQEILPLRTRNARGIAFLAQGVPENYQATNVLAGK